MVDGHAEDIMSEEFFVLFDFSMDGSMGARNGVKGFLDNMDQSDLSSSKLMWTYLGAQSCLVEVAYRSNENRCENAQLLSTASLSSPVRP